MIFDLGLAMRRQEEFESARLTDFAFRLRARSARLLARSLGVSDIDVVALVATVPEDRLCAQVAVMVDADEGEVRALYDRHVARRGRS